MSGESTGAHGTADRDAGRRDTARRELHEPPGGAGHRRVHLLIEGRVQGVWFRDSTYCEATRLGVNGWVRNLPDGRVEAAYEGAPEAVQGLIAWTHHGPERALVTRVEISEEPPEGERGFSVR